MDARTDTTAEGDLYHCGECGQAFLSDEPITVEHNTGSSRTVHITSPTDDDKDS